MTKGEAVNWLINIMADIGKAEHSELWHYEQALSEIREILESEPEWKAGKWVNNTNGTYECSECGCKHGRSNFCPNCGAEMEEAE